MNSKIVLFLSSFLFYCMLVNASRPSWVDGMPFSPAFFGPNALPVPDFNGGRIDSLSSVQLSVDYNFGSHDYTQSLYFRSDWVLLPQRVAFAVWFTPVERYSIHSESALKRGLPMDRLRGVGCGDAYLGTYIALLREGVYRPGVVLGAVMKMAVGEHVREARFFDTPGYYFDLAVGKRLGESATSDFSVDVALTTGFLCWQTSQFRQNDAVMWGGRVALNYRSFTLSSEVGGYVGWQRNGDVPIVIKTELRYRLKRVILALRYQHGIQDFPHHQLRVGVSVPFDLGFHKR